MNIDFKAYLQNALISKVFAKCLKSLQKMTNTTIKTQIMVKRQKMQQKILQICNNYWHNVIAIL